VKNTALLTRYTTSDDGSHHKLADIYTLDEHGIQPEMLDRDALKVANRLDRNGFEAYIVGGAVRDLLLDKAPKDFDIATNAFPKQIRKLFRNSRIIGRRFRLVHVHFGEKIIEVSTFRSESPEGKNNVYGALEEDVHRRDFSLNALYYSPKTRYIIDFVGAFADIKSGRMRSLQPLDVTFKEDPVRLIRAIKYSVTTGFSLPRRLKAAIKRDAPELEKSSVSRLTEELFKILLSGYSAGIMREIQNLGLLEYLLPEAEKRFHGRADSVSPKQLFQNLEELDKEIRRQPSTDRGTVLSHFLEAFLTKILSKLDVPEPAEYVFCEAKDIFMPLTPPNREIEKAVRLLMKQHGLKGAKRRRIKRGPSPEK